MQAKKLKPPSSEQMRVFERKAHTLKALAHPLRLWIVQSLLGEKQRCVCEFVDASPLDFSTVSRHLQVLKTARVISSKKIGKWVYYSLNMPCASGFLDCLDEKIS